MTKRKSPTEHAHAHGDSHVLTKLLQTARELHKSGQMSDAELSYLVLLANTKPVNEAELMARVEEKYPRGNQSVALEEILSPERIAEIRSLR